METNQKHTEKYKSFIIIIEHDGAKTGNDCFTWVVNRADGSNIDISEFEHETQQGAITEAKQEIDQMIERFRDKSGADFLVAFLQHMEDYGPWEFRDKKGTVEQFLASLN
jgi:hypothetical protein